MRWRFVDRIEAFEPWASAKGRKSISLEEYSLLEPLGRKGMFPETLVLESCIHLGRWLVMRSSDFEKSCLLSEARNFAFMKQAGIGQVLTMTALVRRREGDALVIGCEATIGQRQICKGDLTLSLMPLREVLNREGMKAMWQELYGKA